MDLCRFIVQGAGMVRIAAVAVVLHGPAMRRVVMPMRLWPGLACVIGRADALSERLYYSSTTPRGVRSGGDDAGLVGDHDELDAVSRAQLREDAGDVRLDR